MTWFSVIKRKTKLKPEIIKDTINKIMDRKGSFQVRVDGQEFVENYLNYIQNTLEDYKKRGIKFRSPEYQEMFYHLQGVKYLFKSYINFSALINTYAKNMFEYSIRNANKQLFLNGNISRYITYFGLRNNIIQGGNIYFKNRENYEKFLSNFPIRRNIN